MIYSLYIIRCLVTGEKYVGCSGDVAKRWREHKLCARKPEAQSRLYLCMKRYGIKNFSIEVIASARGLEDAQMCERSLIGQHNTYMPHGLNMTLGGEGADGHIPGASTRAKMSAAGKGRKKSAEWRAKISAAHMGKKKSPEAVEKSRASRMGMRPTPESIAKGQETKRRNGYVVSAETRALMSRILTGKKRSTEQRERIRQANIKYAAENPITPERRAKLVAAASHNLQNPEWVAKRVAARRATLEERKLVYALLAA
jgi:group I intron endonuclease